MYGGTLPRLVLRAVVDAEADQQGNKPYTTMVVCPFYSFAVLSPDCKPIAQRCKDIALMTEVLLAVMFNAC